MNDAVNDEGQALAAVVRWALGRSARTSDELDTMVRQFADGEKAVVISGTGGGRVDVATLDREAGFLVFDVTVAGPTTNENMSN